MKIQQISQSLLIKPYLPMHQIKPPHSIEEKELNKFKDGLASTHLLL